MPLNTVKSHLKRSLAVLRARCAGLRNRIEFFFFLTFVMDINRALERAMDAEDPGPAFAGRVVAAIKAFFRRRRTPVTGPADPLVDAVADDAAAGGDPRLRRRACGGGSLHWRRPSPGRAHEEARGRAAHTQLVQALRLTGGQIERRAPRHRAEPGVGFMKVTGCWDERAHACGSCRSCRRVLGGRPRQPGRPGPRCRWRGWKS